MEGEESNSYWPFPTRGTPLTTYSFDSETEQAVAPLVMPAANQLDTDPCALAPLYHRVDPSSVGRLLESFPNTSPDGIRLAIEASWDSVSVIVRDDGYVMTYLPAQTPNQLEPLVELEHDWSGPASLSWSIGRAIVTARDGAVEASAFDPVFEVVETLCEYIDADALDRVLRPSRDSDTATSRLLLSVDGYEVTVTADGSIAVEPSLSVLKRSGSALLVTGTAPESGFDRTAAMLLGTPERNRTPVFVYYGQDIAAARHRLSRAEYDPAVGTVLDCQTATARTTASAAGGNNHGPHQPDGDATPTVVPISGGIEAIPEAVRETAATTGPFDPGQLRVEIDSVDSMLASTTLEKTHRTLDGISRVIRTHRGIGHFLLPASVDDDTVASLVPMFDGVVEIRVGEAELEQQWRLTTTGYETTWFPFE